MKAFDDPHVLLAETSLVDRFVKYVKVETTSDEHKDDCPSTKEQFVLARILVDELKELGLDDAAVDDNCYVTATLKGNAGSATVGLIAHLDTSPAAPGANVTPVFHENYDGSVMELKDGIVIGPDDNPNLKKCIGDTVITADGTTLLGADDKAGIAEIVSAMEYYKKNPDLPRPTIRICFTPDEEIGRGSAKFPVKDFGADVAFTLDGTFDGEINIETFHADSAFVTVTGVSTHPGTAKGKLVNALRYMSKFIERLPAEISPEHTEKREGFIHPYELNGDASSCKCHLILRDFEEEQTTIWGDKVKEVAATLTAEEPRLKVDVEIKHSYPNMFKFLKDRPEIAVRLKKAVELTGLTPDLSPIRGGTDGSNLTRMGLPCPNIFAGGMNFHGQTEWISTRSMGRSLCTILNLMTLYAD
ncbi:MAG: peptidase T [Deltaproteobacteria bacterium]|nr:peptidase T [Deltaproteobacteria bacterium]